MFPESLPEKSPSNEAFELDHMMEHLEFCEEIQYGQILFFFPGRMTEMFLFMRHLHLDCEASSQFSRS